ncbi:MAG: hypothetical protein AVO35_04500 [Candidatus Aegiribacteria sp. MLS_C]|nr:MAG: hypothetical protein AVO35_04500 [Candidatus Aegiribacteria sp. MLS_C]
MSRETGSSLQEMEERLAAASGDRERVAALAELSWAVKYSDPSRAVSLADEAIEISGRVGFEDELPKCYMSRAIGLMHMSRFKAAETAARNGMELYRRTGNEAGVRHALNVTGSVFFRWGRYASALENYLEAHSLHMKLSGSPDPGILSNLGAVYLQLGDTERALEKYVQVYEMAEGLEGPADLKTAALINMGEIYGRMGMYEAALDYLNMASEMAEAGSMKQAMAVVADNTGTVMTVLERYEEAMENYGRSIRMFRELEDEKGEALVLANMGRCVLEAGHEGAMEYFREANVIFRRMNDSQGASDTLVGIARVLAGAGRRREALDRLAEALEIAGNKDLKPQLSDIHRYLSSIFEEEGSYEKALMHLQLHHDIEERLKSERAANRLRNLRVVHEVEQARKEASLYRLRNIELEREKQALEQAAGRPGEVQGPDARGETEFGRMRDFGVEMELELILQRVHAAGMELREMLTLAIESSENLLDAGTLPEEAGERLEKSVEAVRKAFPLVNYLENLRDSNDETSEEQTADRESLQEYMTDGGSYSEHYILVVEDDPEVAELLITFFEANEYPVAVASSLKRTLEMLESDKGEIGCVFVDLLLPDGSGIDLLRSIRERSRSLPILAGSGYPVSPRDMEYLRENRIVFMQKPYNLDTLMLNISIMMPT